MSRLSMIAQLGTTGFVLMSACADDRSPPGATAAPSTALDVRVQTGRSADVSTLAQPNAVCGLTAGDGTPADHAVYADDHGIVRFSVGFSPDADPAVPMDFTLACHSVDGRLVRRAVRVSIDDQHPSQPSEVNVVDAAQPSDVIRPALTGDPMRLTQEELLARGYPPRPNPAESAPAFQTWLEMVSEPTRLVSGQQVQTQIFNSSRQRANQLAGASNSTSSSNNWSGFVLDAGGATYDLVQGEWNQPTVLVPATGSNFLSKYAAVWAGLDGNSSNDVVQDGTTGEALHIGGFGSGWYISYWAWIEYFPNASVSLSNFPVGPNDHIVSEVWAGDGSGAINPSGGYGWFVLQNTTNHHSYSGFIAKPGNASPFSGESAEWIVERPEINGSLTPLANYQTATVFNIRALTFADGNLHNHNLFTDPSIAVTMFNGSTPLSIVSEQSSTQMLFTWLASQ